jgi:hypothetical protein
MYEIVANFRVVITAVFKTVFPLRLKELKNMNKELR